MRATLALALALATPLGACGYSVDRYRGHDADAAGELPTVAILPFDNETFRRGLEIELSRQLADELRGRTGRTPADPRTAAWVLKGSVVAAGEQVLSEDTGDRIRESSFVVTVRVQVEDRASEKLLGAYTLTESEPFSDRAGRIATLEQAQTEALRDLAEGLVNWLERLKPKATS